MLQEIKWAIRDGFDRLLGQQAPEPKPRVFEIEGLAIGEERERLVADYSVLLKRDILTKADYAILHDIMLRLLGYQKGPMAVGSEHFPRDVNAPILVDQILVGDEPVKVNIEYIAHESPEIGHRGMWGSQGIRFRYEVDSFDGWEYVSNNPGFNIVGVGKVGEGDVGYFSYVLREKRLHEWEFLKPHLMKPTLIRSLELYEASRVWENPDALEFPEPNYH